MKIKIKDKKRFLQITVGLLLIIVIIALSLPHILNAVFGNSIKDEVITIMTDVVSEIDAGFVDGKFAVYNSQGLKKYNQKGEYESEHYVSAYSPLMHCKGDYVALGDTADMEVTILKGNEIMYEIKAPQTVKCVTVNKKGYTTVITGETGYKSLVIVYDNKGEEKYRWYSDESYAVDAKLSDDSKKLVVASVKMNVNKVTTVVEQYKLNSESAISKVEIEDLIPYSVSMSGSKVVLIGDNKAYTINSSGNIKSEYDYKGKVLECFDTDNVNNIVLALSEDAGATDVVILNNSLKEKGKSRCDFLVTMLDENKGKVIAGNDGNVKIITEKGTTLLEEKISKDGNFIVLSDNWRKFAIYSSGYINIFTVERGRK